MTDELKHVFRAKYGNTTRLGWGPRARQAARYYTPDEYYEATVARLVTTGCSWLDVGGGHDVFPSNRALASELVSRCGKLTAVDPDVSVHENALAHERVQAMIEDYSGGPFDLATLRMVAEHIDRPEQAVASLARLVKPGGAVVIYTINQWSAISLAAWLTPLWFHHAVKSRLWGTEEKDTFPVAYKMNTRGKLRSLFQAGGFYEESFRYLDDCRTFHQFRLLHHVELTLWQALRAIGWHYPETCLLGVYRRPAK
ncbi:MAG TPA: methyltransferase domain-containing protein [Gemmata sp.]|nr:methyltransferase domain-containing protein [Gemmata sp.]